MLKSIVFRKVFKFTRGELWTIVTIALAAECFLHLTDGFTRVHLFRLLAYFDIAGVVMNHEKIW